ncbi:hypothetical protein HS1_000345 [Candidatus Desulfofervidus auxilii]|uniref:DUF465 domain-containing protein n=2 Tax=Desulfofervidus auxilii TaxID=1621989 RepID=A0A7U4QIV4_DESA2|nr:DUF465 domain-containing protein [Candidatus Desulfofervidus auxilii]CAD7770641.1 hypothetical protein BLFGPEAP_00403 [Candidatus Methanoperedenaceae archaeon GB50]CAD7771722.1 hypothetical protein DMNBHIDG_00444 [Candidatus Methanoperedenaceae archaeon GB37]AMM40151.1 hypothetical protein HS1_000345 [Candidatus Desulfofervidus auxilii]CAD7783152.1 MAG: hypothetical protein KIIPBIDF_01980 [Candidatus Methanoperedenaceae archaeon GB50]CAD7783520.1 MAG: hypothetical protein KCCBMMGE_01922 [Ca
MEQKEIDLISKLINKDQELKKLWEEHLELEEKIEEYNKRVYLTPEEELEKNRLKKIKLAGKDKILAILKKYKREMGI